MNKILNVAVATDTILYAPFYLALYGGDFEDTPFGELEINIIGQEGDMFFITDNLPSKAVDGFVTLALFFGYADVGICDPSFIIDLYTTDKFKESFAPSLNSFISSLKEKEKNAFYQRYNELFNGKKPDYNKIESKLKKKFSIKIIGGLIKKIAFVVVGKPNLNVNGNFPYVHAPFFNEYRDMHVECNKIITSPTPSTGYFIGSSVANKNSKPILEKNYGEELNHIIKNGSTGDLALSCDFVAIDQYGDDLQEYDDYVSHSKNAMFTGIIANFGNISNVNKYKAFLYGIEKNLYNIDKILNNRYDNDLSNYFQKKLLNQKHTKFKKEGNDIISFLVADTEIENRLKEDDPELSEEANNKRLSDNIDDLIYSFIQRLYKWKRAGRFLYYDTIRSDIQDLLTISKIRNIENNLADDSNFSKYYNFDLLNNWMRIDKTITRKHKKWFWRTFTNESVLLFFTAVFVTVESIALFIKIVPIKIFHFADGETFKLLPNLEIKWNSFFIFLVVIFTISIFSLFWKSHKYIRYSKQQKYSFDLNRKKGDFKKIPSNFRLWFDRKIQSLKKSKK